MKYLVKPLGDAELPTVFVNDVPIKAELFTVACNPMIPLVKLKNARTSERTKLLNETVAMAQAAIARELYLYAKAMERAEPKGKYMVFMVRTEPQCLSADEPPRAIWDDFGEWDEETQNVVRGPDAKVIGETEAKIGWNFSTVLAMVMLEQLPDGYTEDEVIDTVPFWAKPSDIPDFNQWIRTPQGRAKLAVGLGSLLGYGAAPVNGLTPTQLVPNLLETI